MRGFFYISMKTKQLNWLDQVTKKSTFSILQKKWPKWYYGKRDLKQTMYYLLRDGFGSPEIPSTKEICSITSLEKTSPSGNEDKPIKIIRRRRANGRIPERSEGTNKRS